jgi:N6-L-threonylcarbamoyladenine synthase
LKHAGADKSLKQIKAIAVTYGYGLLPALVQGVGYARQLAGKFNKPLVAVNHMEGHIYSNWLKPIGVNDKLPISNFKLFPAVVLIVSGGHTALILMKGHGQYQILGETLDDAAGECFDKGARLLGLGYPGGPVIDKLARQGDPKAFSFPSPMIHAKNYDFSFSGLKTSLLYFLRDHHYDFSGKLSGKKQSLRQDISAGFQRALVRVLVEKTLRAAAAYRAKTILVGGGVAANSYLQKQMTKAAQEKNIACPVVFPAPAFITDNAAMIAAAGYIRYCLGRRDNPKTLEADAGLRLV